MPAPFYNAIKGTTAGTPGTGSFTPNAASTGFIAWSTAHSGWAGLVRYEDGSAWELSYGYWNATAITRPSGALVASSTGSQLSLTSSATAAMVADANEVQPSLGSKRHVSWTPIPGSTTVSASGIAAPTVTGTAGTLALATTNFMTENTRVQAASATSANAQAGFSNTVNQVAYSPTTGRGGFEISYLFGANQLPTSPRLFAGLTDTTMVASTGEPSALVGSYAVFSLDSTDTNFQLLSNDGTSTGTKTTTTIPWTVNGFYRAKLWSPPGGGTLYGLLIRLDDPSGSNIWYGSKTSDLPATVAMLSPQIVSGLNGSNTGTALNLHFGGMGLRAGG